MNWKNIVFTKVLPLSVTFVTLAAFAQENNLGSSRKVEGVYTENLKQAVDSALPSFNEAGLSLQLKRLHSQYANGAPGVSVRDFQTLAKTFGLPTPQVRPGETYTETASFALGLDPKSGKVLVHKNLETLPALSQVEAKRALPLATRNHQALLTKLGVDTKQVFFAESTFMNLQSASDPKLGRSEVSPVVVDAILYEGVRGLGGFLVDGSSFKLSSKNAQTVEGADLVWPTVRFHPGLRKFEVRKRAELSQEILRQVTDTTSKGDKVNVKMAVVLRPVQTSAGEFFIPALRVGVLSARNEGGNMFYVNLVNDQTPYVEPRAVDSSEGGGN